MANSNQETREYNPKEIEPKWQQRWMENKHHKAVDLADSTDAAIKPKMYCLDMFPYPSAQGLHVGHPEGYTATDIISRMKRMQGYNVLHPMGWDAFGLPAENYAIKTGVDPDTSTHQNINNFRRQIQALGLSYDWTREVDTSSPEYYRWTQWMFLQMVEHGLAYKKNARVNWCETCQTVLANEQVVDGNCERSKDPVVQKEMEQWFFNITDYADRLLHDLDTIDWPEPIKLMQRNWIGRSEGTEVDFRIESSNDIVTVYTTRVDTLYSAAFLVLAPEHPLVKTVTALEQQPAVTKYVEASMRKTELDRTADKEKTGVFTGAYAVNPINDKKIPIWVGDFVLLTYGTGAVFGDAHDERDFEMAKKYGIPLTVTIRPVDDAQWKRVQQLEECYSDDGVLVNSGEYNGLSSAQARQKITAALETINAGRRKINYKLRDWLISRQRYWGAPIPIVYDPDGKPHPVKEEQLPLLLPTDVDYLPKGTSPLGTSKEYAARAEELYGKGWRFEVDTMDTFVCSSWYYLRYCDPHNNIVFADQKKLAYWLPINLYVGGAEHAVLHLLYARFFHKALQDFGYIPQSVGPEPFASLRNQGMILGEDHQKMSKSAGNVINPDEIISQYGADTMRLYEMFMGPFEDTKPWDTHSIIGMRRFIERVWKLVIAVGEVSTDKEMDEATQRQMHKTTKQVTADIEGFHFNTAISALMVFSNHLTARSQSEGSGRPPRAGVERLLVLFAPFAPHVAEELWEMLGHTTSIGLEPWPTYDEALTTDSMVTIGVQVNGKIRGTIELSPAAPQEEASTAAQAEQNVRRHLEGKTIRKIVYVPGKIVNIIAS